MGKLLAMDRSVLDLPAFRAAQEKFESVVAEMQQYEATLEAEWCSQVRCHCLTSEWSVQVCCPPQIIRPAMSVCLSVPEEC